jgi:hypothetical protein
MIFDYLSCEFGLDDGLAEHHEGPHMHDSEDVLEPESR